MVYHIALLIFNGHVKSARILCYVVCDSEGFFVMLNSKLSRKGGSESVWHLLIVFYKCLAFAYCFLLFAFCFNFFANNLNFSLLKIS